MPKRLLPYLFVLVLCVCQGKNGIVVAPAENRLQLFSTFDTEMKEPSGLSLGEHNQSLWTVSDPPENKVYEMDLQGNILRTLKFNGEDLEGVEYDSSNKVIWIIDEKKRELIKLDTSGTVLEHHEILVENPNKNEGLEGISITASNQFWLVNQKNPCEVIELNSNFSIRAQFTFDSIDDLSGLCNDAVAGQFWMLSSANRLLIQWSQTEGIIDQYNLPMNNPEGIAIDFSNNLVYIVSDFQAKLFIFQLKPDK
ncbi:SdiA-regulated domain-containing protein [candidate division KSB1 bacterium]|nr:SdiA-regulated domain-containing protein [candidate division KSB1 bacterium]